MAVTLRTYIVRGMRCAGCSKNLEKSVSALQGAENVSVNYFYQLDFIVKVRAAGQIFGIALNIRIVCGGSIIVFQKG